MNVPLITMPREEARRKLQAYRRDLHKDTEQIYAAAAQGYEALAAGTPLLRLSLAFQQAGVDAQHRPRLAIARADRPECELTWFQGRREAHFATTNQRRHLKFPLRVTVDMGLENQIHPRRHINGFALVPLLPADKRPATGQLRDWHILWEVEQWFDKPRQMKAPTDPLLLKHIGGDLWAVLAQWDLTPLEQAILEGSQRN